MATNLDLENALVEQAVKVGGHKSKKAAVTEALKEYIRKREQQKIKELFGKIDYDPDYDYKEQRARR